VKKIQLNDEQWKTLQALLEYVARPRAADSSIKVSSRLRSNGLVALDPEGRSFLTDQGLRRLSQGR
jgi:Mn-dependent DtxR family transcriptional regulator